MAEGRPLTELQRETIARNLARGRENQRLRREGKLPPLTPKVVKRKRKRTSTVGRVGTPRPTVPTPISPGTPLEQAPFRGPGKVSAVARKNVLSLLTMAIGGADWVAGSAPLTRQLWTAEDRLEQEEVALLVKGIYGELESWPKLLEWLAKLAEQGVHGQLVYAVVVISLPRLARHGVIPPDVAALFAWSLSQQQPFPTDAEPNPDPFSVAAGATPQPDWHDGNGQVDVSSVPGRGAPVHGGFSEQAG